MWTSAAHGVNLPDSVPFPGADVDICRPRIIEPVIILILGVVIAFILIAMYLPLFDLIGQLGA